MHLVRSEELLQHLQKTFVASPLKDAAVGFLYETHSSTAAAGESFECGAAAGAQTVPLGCLTRLLTGALLRRAVSNGLFDFETTINTILGPTTAALANVTVRQLFDHTHGVDDSNVGNAPLRCDGTIDTEQLCAALGRGSFIAPARRLSSYGDAGAWLGAAILESIHRNKYSDILNTQLFAPLGISATHDARIMTASGAPITCAATGGSLAVSIDGLLKFLDHHISMENESYGEPEALRASHEILALPGWHFLERGIHLGWKHYGGAWFGHNSDLENAAVLVRVNPEKRIGIVVASRFHSPTSVASALFRKCFPDLMSPRIPRMLQGASLNPQAMSRFAGKYRNSALTVSITNKEGSELQLELYGNQKPQPNTLIATTVLQAAHEDIFFMKRPAANLSFVQFICPKDSTFEYIWTGSQVLPRV